MPFDVLLVDDSALSRRFVRQCLEIAGLRECSFLEAANGAKALERLEAATQVRLVVTDLNMPEMDGEALLRNIRANPRWATVKVVVVTSLQNAVRRASLESAGAFAVLGKPVTPALVAPVVQALLKEISP